MSSEEKLCIYTSNSSLYSLDWDWKQPNEGRIAFTSYVEGLNNKVSVIKLDESSNSLNFVTSADHEYPPTKVMWSPCTSSDKPDLLATTGDALRIWNITGTEIKEKSKLNSVCFFFFCL
jgi:WD repeat-containing protein 68